MHGKHEATPTAPGFCQGNLFLYIQCRGEEEREELQNCPINANKISTAVGNHKTGAKRGEGEAGATLSFNKFMIKMQKANIKPLESCLHKGLG